VPDSGKRHAILVVLGFGLFALVAVAASLSGYIGKLIAVWWSVSGFG